MHFSICRKLVLMGMRKDTHAHHVYGCVQYIRTAVLYVQTIQYHYKKEAAAVKRVRGCCYWCLLYC